MLRRIRFSLFIVLCSVCALILFALREQPSAQVVAQNPFADLEHEDQNFILNWNQYFNQQRAYPLKQIPANARLNALAQAKKISSRAPLKPNAPLVTGVWANIGPTPINSGATFPPLTFNAVTGRVTAIAVDPTRSNTVYVGGAQGGVWKTTDGGTTWDQLTDQQATLAIGSIALAPSSPNTIYVGTGEGDVSCDSYFGAGILKSTDGGVSWTLVGQSAFNQLSISKIVVHPTDPNTLYASAMYGYVGMGCDYAPAFPSGGVWKSTDGGTTWSKVFTASGSNDLVMDPQAPTTLFVANYYGGLARTTNGGSTWSQLTNGLPAASSVDRYALTLSRPSAGSAAVLYAGAGTSGVVYKSSNNGDSWGVMSSGASGYCSGQCWFDNVITADPTNASVALVGGSANYANGTGIVYRTTNGGSTWSSVAGGLHADAHAIAFDPSNTQTVWVGTDGGVFKSTMRGGTNGDWAAVANNFALTQFETLATHPTDQNFLLGGTQDNGTIKWTGGISWMTVRTGDAGYVWIDQLAPQTMYHTFSGVYPERSDNGGVTWKNLWGGSYSLSTGDRSAFYPPLVGNPNSSTYIYLGTYRLWRYNKTSDNWQALSDDLTTGCANNGCVISSVAVAPSNGQVLYVGTSAGLVRVSMNGGSAWSAANSSLLPNRFVTRVAIDPTTASIAYASFSGFNETTLKPGHVFQTTSSAATWTDISGNLPNVPTNALVVDPQTPTTIYAGTDIGVFYTTNVNGSSTTWNRLGFGLPNVAVFDLKIGKYGPTVKMYAATHGRGAWTFTLNAPQNISLPMMLNGAP